MSHLQISSSEVIRKLEMMRILKREGWGRIHYLRGDEGSEAEYAGP